MKTESYNTVYILTNKNVKLCNSVKDLFRIRSDGIIIGEMRDNSCTIDLKTLKHCNLK